MLQLHQLGADPDGVSPNVSTGVTFTVLLTGAPTPPNKIKLEHVDAEGNPIRVLGYLADDGKDGDLQSKDGIYSGSFRIFSKTEGQLYYRAIVSYEGQDYISDTFPLAITAFPIGPAPSDPNFLVSDPKSKQNLYSNELVVVFLKGTLPYRIRQIVVAEGGLIVGTIPTLRVFQLRILSDGTASGVYAAIKRFQAYKEVEYAEPNYVVELDDG